MHTPSWASDRPTASRCSVVGFVTPPHRAAAGGPPEAEDGRGGPGRALGGGVSVSILQRLTMCTITLSLAKRGEAIPGPYSSLTCFAGVRPGAVPERGEIEGHRHRRARWTFHSGQKTRHSGRCGACRKLSGEARDRL